MTCVDNMEMVSTYRAYSSPADPERQGPGHEPCLTLARRFSCSIYNCILSSFTDENVLSKISILMK